jgi:hypothetical protein
MHQSVNFKCIIKLEVYFELIFSTNNSILRHVLSSYNIIAFTITVTIAMYTKLISDQIRK